MPRYLRGIARWQNIATLLIQHTMMAGRLDRINLGTAKALGLTLRQSVLGRADDIIQ